MRGLIQIINLFAYFFEKVKFWTNFSAVFSLPKLSLFLIDSLQDNRPTNHMQYQLRKADG